MVEETTTTNPFSFDNILERAKLSLFSVKEAEARLNTEKRRLFEIVREYNKKRLEVFEENLRVRKILWCTWCNKMVPMDDTGLVLVVSRNKESCGYEGGDYCFRTRTSIHRVCGACRQEIYMRNGSYGLYDRGAEDQESFAAYEVELHDDGYYKKSGSSKLEEGIELPKMQRELFSELCTEWGIPPELGLDRNGNLAVKTNGNEVLVP